jgi:hypothetical protein
MKRECWALDLRLLVWSQLLPEAAMVSYVVLRILYIVRGFRWKGDVIVYKCMRIYLCSTLRIRVFESGPRQQRSGVPPEAGKKIKNQNAKIKIIGVKIASERFDRLTAKAAGSNSTGVEDL